MVRNNNNNNNNDHYQKSSQHSQVPHHHNRERQNYHRQQHQHQHSHNGESFHQQQQSNQQQQPPPLSLNLPPPLPPGWVEATDPSTGKIYYANPQTQETQWDRPVMVPPPPPSEPPPQPPQPHFWNVQVRVPASAAQYYDGIRTNQATGRSTGEGNQLFTAGGSAMRNVAVAQPEKIVSEARKMLEKAQAFPSRTIASDLELHSLNAGQIADLCKLQKRAYQEIQQEKHRQQKRKRQQLQEPSIVGGNDNTDAANDGEVQYVPLPPYTPINPFTMPLGILVDRAEPGRLDVRMISLRGELKSFGYAPSTRN